MKTVLIVTADNALRARLLRAFANCSVFVAPNDSEALKTLRVIPVDIVLRDSSSARDLGRFVTRVKELAPVAVVIAIEPTEEEAEAADFSLRATFTQRELESALRHMADRQRLILEASTLRSQIMASPPPTLTVPDIPPEAPAFARVLKEFSRLFAAGFDVPRMLEVFLDAIGELLRPVRSALLLPDDSDQLFRIAAHRGLAPQIVDSLRLSATEGLARWLALQGRPARLHELGDVEVARELTLLQGVVAVPLLTRGELVAMLVVGQPVIGGSYGRQETEILFDLATQLANALRDVTLHNRLEREKEFNERILTHMSSGVITISRTERIGTINRRAEEILQLPAAEVVDHDLRVLPSPLGDMLFETLSTGRTLPRAEIQLALRKLWLEVSTYPVYGDEPSPLGAVLVFEDLTAQKELAAQKRQAEEFQLLARVIARIADEIKNPLVSVNTCVELINERYDDPEFRKTFATVVGRDVRRLVQVFEKLAGLVSEGELNFTTVDVHSVVDEVVSAIELSDEGLGKRLHVDVVRETTPQLVKADAAQLRKAVSYLVWYLAHNSPGDQAKVSVSVGQHGQGDGDTVRILVGSRTAVVAPDKLERLFDPVQMVQESLIDVGPAVSQRLVEALGGQLHHRQGRHELDFLVTLPRVTS